MHLQANAQKVAESMRSTQGGGQEGQDKATAQAEAADIKAIQLEKKQLANAKADLAARMAKARANGEDMSQFAAEEAAMKTKESGLAAKEATAAAHKKQVTEVTDYMLDQKVASADERSAKDKEKAATVSLSIRVPLC